MDFNQLLGDGLVIDSQGTQEAFVWFAAPIVAESIFAIILWIISIFIIVIIIYSKLKGDKMAIIGMQEAGKSTILNYMRGLRFDPIYQPTEKEQYPRFHCKLGDNRTITISAGYDVGGGNEWFDEQSIKEAVKDNDIIMFVFDASKFLNEDKYKRQTLARLDFVFVQIKEKNSDVDDFIKEHFALIGTHADCIKNPSKLVIQKLQRDYSHKPYSQIFKNNIAILDLTRGLELSNFLNKIF